MSNDVKKMIGHEHAWQMLQYAEDAAKTSAPWKLWESCRIDESSWSSLEAHPLWANNYKYRRKPVKWQPIGGEWFIASDDSVYNYPSRNDYKVFERPTKEQAERAAVEMRKFNRLLALRDELCCYETFDSWNCEDNNIPKYYLNFNHYNYDKMIWDFEINYYVNYTGICFSSAKTAQRACDMLNSGEVEL
jgi:hypothetical protein